jgi:hypothetical protein
MAEVDQRLQGIGSHQSDVSAPAAVTAVRGAPGFKAQPFETDGAGTAMAGQHRNFGFIGKVPTGQSRSP